MLHIVYIAKVTQGPDEAPGNITQCIHEALGNKGNVYFCTLSDYDPDGKLVEIMCDFSKSTSTQRAEAAQKIKETVASSRVIFIHGEVF